MISAKRLACVASALVLGLAVAASAQDADEGALAGLSRQMRLGIRYYEKGEDLQAMDRFMEVLTRGDPAERSMANEYINLITHRMNTGEKGPTRPASLRPNEATVEPALPPKAKGPAAAEVVVEPGGSDAASAAPPRPERPTTAPPAAPPPKPSAAPLAAPPEAALSPTNKALMKKEIKAKIRNLLESGLRELKAYEDIRILMMETGDPQAIGIPSGLLFQSGIAFQKDAVKILDAVTKMAYSLGSAQVIILPEGTAIGDAKVLDMRRTMGISAHLYSAGIAPPRVRVNLLNTQVDIPRPFQDFKGIVVLFVYNQPMSLVVESSIGEEAGPPLSLGVFPVAIRPDKSEGAVIEFSVEDPPAGLVSWKFQLLQPSTAGGADLAPLQEVVGGSPVFHQIYWNGRQNYFGSALPAGRYECVLTATDGKNRQRTMHSWIQLLDSSGGATAPLLEKTKVPAAAAAPATVAAGALGAPPAELPQAGEAKPEGLIKEKAGKVTGVEIGRKKAAVKAAKKPRAGRKAPSGKKEQAEEPAPAAPQEKSPEAAAAAAPAAKEAPPAKPTKPAAGNYELDFNKNTYQLTPEAERRLAQVAETMTYYPMENLKIVGYAQSGEDKAPELSEKRAQMVAGLLINKYQVDPKRIQVASAVADLPAHKVQINFVKSE